MHTLQLEEEKCQQYSGKGVLRNACYFCELLQPSSVLLTGCTHVAVTVTIFAIDYNLDVSGSEAAFLKQLENSSLCDRNLTATTAYDDLSSLNVTDTDIPNDTTVID